MKKIAIIMAAVFMVGCGSNTGTQEKLDMQQHAKNMVTLVKHDLDRNHLDTTKVECVYNEEKKCVDVSWKGELMTISYNIYSPDYFEESSNYHADDFIISMVLFNTEAKNISDMELTLVDDNYVIIPMENKRISDKHLIVGFSITEKSFRVCMERLANSKRAILRANLHSDKGSIRIPLQDAVSLRNMARSYLKDGGKFE